MLHAGHAESTFADGVNMCWEGALGAEIWTAAEGSAGEARGGNAGRWARLHAGDDSPLVPHHSFWAIQADAAGGCVRSASSLDTGSRGLQGHGCNTAAAAVGVSGNTTILDGRKVGEDLT